MEMNVLPEVNKGDLFSVFLFLQSESITHRREVFNFLDLIGELGGVIEVFILIFGVVLYPISKFSFFLKATKMLFHARTSDSSMFVCKNSTT
jgi:hypothetical protein